MRSCRLISPLSVSCCVLLFSIGASAAERAAVSAPSGSGPANAATVTAEPASQLSPNLSIEPALGSDESLALVRVAPGESMGELTISDIFLEPGFSYLEGRKGSFSQGSSYLALSWYRDRRISATVKLGTAGLLGQPRRFALQPIANQIEFVESYAQADSLYGRLRLGLIPIPFGLEGGDAERRLLFPRSQLFRERFMVLRDQGVSYRISANGFFSDVAIHNGEGGADLDNEIWLTSRVGWQGGRFLQLGFSGSVGRTSPASTDPNGTASSANAWMDVGKAAKIRIVNLFVEWLDRPWDFVMEATTGDTIQGDLVIKTVAGHVDLTYDLGETATLLTRYDLLSPRNDVASPQMVEYSGGLALRTAYRNANLYLIGTKKVQQDVKQDEHRGLIIWRIAPTATSVMGPL